MEKESLVCQLLHWFCMCIVYDNVYTLLLEKSSQALWMSEDLQVEVYIFLSARGKARALLHFTKSAIFIIPFSPFLNFFPTFSEIASTFI